MKRKWLIVMLLLLMAAAAAVLGPGLKSWYVGDDLLETGYAEGSARPFAVWHSSYIGAMIFRPVTGTIYWYTANWFDNFGLHLIDLALQGLNACLLFFLLRALLRKHDRDASVPAFIGALLFAVHPLGARTAAWIACRADLLGTGFSLAALLAAVSAWPLRRRLVLTGILALLAMASKESQLPLGLALAALSLARDQAGGWKRRGGRALLAAAPGVLAAAVYLGWRLWVLGKLGSYEQVESSVWGNVQSLYYHFPRMVAGAGRDFLFHHFRSEPTLIAPLKAGLAVLFILALPAALGRERRMLLAAVALVFVFLLPVWNLSQMLAVREDRLFYSSMLGVALALAAVVAAPRHRVLRAGTVAAALVVCATFALWSRFEVREWKQMADGNFRLGRALADYALKGGPTSTARRIYVIGLPPEHYYLDNLVKYELPVSYRDRLIITGDQAGFFWEPKEAAAGFGRPGGVSAEVLPTRESHATLPGMVFETVTPPDLVAAAGLDPYARVVEWDGRRLKEFTDDFKQIYQRRLQIRRGLEREPNLLPSFGFRLNLIPFNWKLAPGLSVAEPDEMGQPYRFTETGHDAWMVSPHIWLPTLAAGRLTITMILPARSFLPPGEDQGCIMWKSVLDLQYGRERTSCFPLIADGREHEYSLALDKNPWWSLAGTIDSFRFDPVSYPTTFELVRMEFLAK